MLYIHNPESTRRIIFLAKLFNSTCTFPFQNLSFHCLLGNSLFNIAWTCTGYTNTILGYFPISQFNHFNIVMVSIGTDEYCTRPPAKLWLGQCVNVISNKTSAKNNHQTIKNIYIYI